MDFVNLQLAVEQLPKAEELQFTGLHKDHRSVRMIAVFLFTALLILVGICILAVSGNLFELNGWLLAICTPLLYMLLAVFFVYKSFPTKGFVIREKDIAYKSGLIFHSTTIVPYNRIQHCEMTQGPIEKTFDLCRIMIYTAGGNDSELVIPGLTNTEGEALRDHLLKQVAANAIS